MKMNGEKIKKLLLKHCDLKEIQQIDDACTIIHRILPVSLREKIGIDEFNEAAYLARESLSVS